jgi:cytochrome c551/c552
VQIRNKKNIVVNELKNGPKSWNCLYQQVKINNSLMLLICILLVSPVFGQEYQMPDNPLKGRFIFEQKGCITCHSYNSESNTVGPDLGRKKFYGSFLELASIMWNHLPEMLRQMRELNLPFPEFSSTEMVDLTAYLYFLRYLGEPGNLYRGKILVEEKGCLTCHAVGKKGEDLAPAFDKLSKYVSPLYLAQSLWNHGPEMDESLQNMGLERPRFEKGEIVDLSAYIRAASRGTKRDKVYMYPGNPQKGKIVFKEKSCLECHRVNEQGRDIGPDLGELELGYSITEIAGLMWNHGSIMGDIMKEQNLKWPKFNGKEMADLIAYLYFLKFEDQPGDPKVGKMVFSKKGCVACHGDSGRGSESAPDLSKSTALSSSINMAQIMWNHAPVMEEKILEKVLSWPEFSGREMSDLYAYLSSLSESAGGEK